MKATKKKLIRDLKRKGIPFKLRVLLADRLRKGALVRYTVYARDKAGKFIPVYTVDNLDD